MSNYKPPESANELLTRYQRGERYFAEVELEEPACDFRGIDLSGVDFTRSFIFADFREANLKSANFTDCNIKTCDFRGANLQDTIFRGASLESTEFGGAILTGADFEGASYSGYIMAGGEMPDWQHTEWKEDNL